MEFWLAGPGISPEVWGNPTGSGQVSTHAISLITNLGPGGTIALILALVAALVGRVRHLVLLSLPSLGGLLGAVQVRYGGARFMTPLAVCLTVVVAAGLGQLLCWQQRRASRAMTIAAADHPGGGEPALRLLVLDRSLQHPRVRDGTIRSGPRTYRPEVDETVDVGGTPRLDAAGTVRVFV